MVAIYCDAATLSDIERYGADQRISGLTTNPSLMRKAGITNYGSFAKSVLELANGKPVSFEVLADDWPTMEAQAREVALWGPNVWCKIPITNAAGESSAPLIERIASLNLNVTAVMTQEQIISVGTLLRPNHILSIFAGRIMDAGQKPPKFKRGGIYRTLWASTREVYNVIEAEESGYDIITMTPDLIAKLGLHGKDLTQYSLETVRMFHEDGKGIEF